MELKVVIHENSYEPRDMFTLRIQYMELKVTSPDSHILLYKVAYNESNIWN